MNVMLRSLGIPSRQMSGFGQGVFDEKSRQWSVNSLDAHSWVEVFFPGYGWIPFEPTPDGVNQPVNRPATRADLTAPPPAGAEATPRVPNFKEPAGGGSVSVANTPFPDIWRQLAIAGGGLMLLLLVLLLLTGHRYGGLERLLDLLHRIPLLDRLARRLEPKRATLAQMDEQITEFYHRRPRRFVQALALEYLSRSIFMFEYVLIALGVGVTITFAQAYVIGGLTSLVQNVIFVVPFEVGTKEGSLYLVFQLLGLDPALGVYTAIVSRLRDLVWIGGGLALVWFSGRRAQERTAAP